MNQQLAVVESGLRWNDIILFSGIIVTLLLGVWNLFSNRRTTYINAVTAERVKWINALRANLSRFAGMASSEATSRAELRQMEMLINLQMNPDDDLGKDISQDIYDICIHCENGDLDIVRLRLGTLLSRGQVLLKKEWDKVKEEAKYGDLKTSVFWKLRKTLKWL